MSVSNIGPGERRKRLVFGVILLILGVAAGAGLVLLAVPRLWRLVAFLPLFVGVMGVLQYRART